MQNITKAATCIAALLGTVSGGVLAQGADTWPNRPVTMIVPFAPGAATDIEGRLYANELTKNLGQQFIMDFKPGGVMTVGMDYAYRQKPDGYSLVYVSSSYSLLPLLYKDKPYDTYKNFEQITLLSKRSAILAVSNNLPVNNIKEYIAYAKANPEKINFATGGVGGIQHLTGLWLESATNTKVTFIHYKAIGASYPDIIAGRTNMVPATFAAGYSNVKAGKMKAIAIASLQRNPLLPDIPTASEQGVTGFEYSSWLGVIAPGGTPAAIVNKVQGEFAKVLKIPEIKQKLGDETSVVGSTPAEFRRHAMGETERWKKLVADNNIKFDD